MASDNTNFLWTLATNKAGATRAAEAAAEGKSMGGSHDEKQPKSNDDNEQLDTPVDDVVDLDSLLSEFDDVEMDREAGLFPLSIATSLALESACGISQEQGVEKPVAIREYDMLWLNLRTLFRNMVGAYGTNMLPSPRKMATDLFDEVATISQIVNQYTRGSCSVTCYFSNYSTVEKKHPGAVVRMLTTTKQKEMFAYANKVYPLLFKMLTKYQVDYAIVEDLLTKWAISNNLVLTHYPYDLLADSVKFRMTLLESHTGAIKTKALWHTKYLDGKSLPMIPFTRQFLQIFGDSETFRPMDPKVRKEIIEIATKYKWNSKTSDSMIHYGLGNMKNKYALEIITNLNNA